MTGTGVRGHEALWRSMGRSFQKGRLGHAYLFVGPRGVGKHAFAVQLARTVLCGKRVDFRPCGQCSACALVQAGTHPDLVLVCRPEEKVEFPIDTVRDLIEHLSLKPARGSRKVAIMDDADDLTEEAANAFLKTLEEPPSGSLLILIGGPVPERQFKTILSRCQVITFAPLNDEVIREILVERGTDPARIDRLVRASGGSPGQAISLDDESLWDFRKHLLASLAAERILGFDLARLWIDFVDAAEKEAGIRRRRAGLVVRLAIGLLQDALRAHFGVRPLVADEAESRVLENLVQRRGPDRILAWLQHMLEADSRIGRSVQIELLFEALADALDRSTGA